MPVWFREAFHQHVQLALTLNWDKSAAEADYGLAAEKLWREILNRERFPAPGYPDLVGGIGQITCPSCPPGCCTLDTKDGVYTCRNCKRQYLVFNEHLEPVIGA